MQFWIVRGQEREEDPFCAGSQLAAILRSSANLHESWQMRIVNVCSLQPRVNLLQDDHYSSRRARSAEIVVQLPAFFDMSDAGQVRTVC